MIQQMPMNGISSDRAEELWSNFKAGFWILFFLHIVVKFSVTAVDMYASPAASQSSIDMTYLVLLIAGLIIALAMVCLVGWTSYRLSGKRSHLFYGFFGALWAGIILIFIAYLVVRDDYRKAAGKTPPKGFSLGLD